MAKPQGLQEPCGVGEPRCATLREHGQQKGGRMYSTFAEYFGVIGRDVLSIGEAIIGLIEDIIGLGGSGPSGHGGGHYPPGQYPLA
ncbi:hypothetical protein [Nocardia thraciensis]